jgi:hypothetical protein
LFRVFRLFMVFRMFMVFRVFRVFKVFRLFKVFMTKLTQVSSTVNVSSIISNVIKVVHTISNDQFSEIEELMIFHIWYAIVPRIHVYTT